MLPSLNITQLRAALCAITKDKREGKKEHAIVHDFVIVTKSRGYSVDGSFYWPPPEWDYLDVKFAFSRLLRRIRKRTSRDIKDTRPHGRAFEDNDLSFARECGGPNRKTYFLFFSNPSFSFFFYIFLFRQCLFYFSFYFSFYPFFSFHAFPLLYTAAPKYLEFKRPSQGGKSLSTSRLFSIKYGNYIMLFLFKTF